MPMLCAPTDNFPTALCALSNVMTMTVVDDNYTGHVEPRTAARRTLPGASIVKVSVGPMDNNAYLVTCSQTGETLLIDAANDAEILLELIERYAPKLSLIVTSHQHQDHWLALEQVKCGEVHLGVGLVAGGELRREQSIDAEIGELEQVGEQRQVAVRQRGGDVPAPQPIEPVPAIRPGAQLPPAPDQ